MYIVFILSLMPTITHTMEQSEKPSTEDAFLKMMAAKRLEQVRQEQQQQTAPTEKGDDNKASTPQFIRDLRKLKKEREQEEKKVTLTATQKNSFFIMHSPPPKFISEQEEKGYIIMALRNNHIGFYLPGHEQELKAHAEKMAL